jgi:putative ABC transport system permease protein
VSGEIALSVVLSIGAGLLIHSFWAMLQVSPGMDPNNMVLARIWIPVPNNPQVNRYLKTPQRETLIRALLHRASAIADVQEAAMGSGSTIPFLGKLRNPFQFSLPDVSTGAQRKGAEFASVSPNYLRVLRAPLISGRFFTEQDSGPSKRVAVVDEAFVRKYSPRQNVIGRRMLAGSPPRDWEIVGVVGDLRGDGLDSPPLPNVYFSIYRNSSFELALFLRTRDDAKTLKEVVGSSRALGRCRASGLRDSNHGRCRVSSSVCRPTIRPPLPLSRRCS